MPSPVPTGVAPVRPAPDFRPHLIEADDPVFLGILANASALAAVLLVWVWNTEPVSVTSIDQIAPRLTKMMVAPAPAPTDVVPPPVPPKPVVTEAMVRRPAPPKAEPSKPASTDPLEAARERKARLDEAEKNAFILKFLGANREGGKGFVDDFFVDADTTTARLDEALKGMGRVELASAGPQLRKSAVGGSRSMDIVAPGLIGGGDVVVDAGPVVRLEGKAELGAADLSLDAGDADAVKRTVQRNFGQLTYCYEQRLNKVPGLAGRVEVEWEVAGGRVTHALVAVNTTDDGDLAQCILGKIRAWRFPMEVQGEIVYPFVFRPK